MELLYIYISSPMGGVVWDIPPGGEVPSINKTGRPALGCHPVKTRYFNSEPRPVSSHGYSDSSAASLRISFSPASTWFCSSSPGQEEWITIKCCNPQKPFDFGYLLDSRFPRRLCSLGLGVRPYFVSLSTPYYLLLSGA